MIHRSWAPWRWLAMAAAAFLLAAGLPQPCQAQQYPRGRPTIYVEDSPAAQDLLKQAQQLLAQKRQADALRIYQRVIEQYPHKLARLHIAPDAPAPGDPAAGNNQDPLEGEANSIMNAGATAGDAVDLYCDLLLLMQQRLRQDPQLLALYRRLYEPAARGALLAALEAPARVGPLQQVFQRYPLTDAALEAGLALAGIFLEQARPASAAELLDQLADDPGLPAQAGRYHLLQAAAGLFAQQPQRYQRHHQALQDAHDQQALAQLQQWQQSLRPPALGFQTTALPGPMALPKTDDSSLWRLRFPPADQNLSTIAAARWSDSQEQPPAGNEDFRILPAASNDLLLLNDGMSVAAVDCSSGQVLWQYQLEAESHDPVMRMPMGMNAPYFDQRGAASDGRRVAAIVGGLFRWPWRQRNTGSSALACLDADSGKLLWQVQSSDLDPTLANSFFHGTPAAVDGGFIALARRSQPSGFQDVFVICVDAAQGTLRWKRHIASSNPGSNYPQEIPLNTQLLVHEQRAYVADNCGCAAALDLRSGAILWLRVQPGLPPAVRNWPGNRVDRTLISEQVSMPVMVDAGLIIGGMRGGDSKASLATIGQPVALVLDPRTGQKRGELDAALWKEGSYMLSAGGDALMVGAIIARFDGKTLEKRWTYRVGSDFSRGPQGRVAITADRVLIPTEQKLIVLDLETGKSISEQALDSPGNLLVLQEELIVAGDSAVRGYLPWERARQRLLAQIATRPADPRPAMALAQVALAAQQDQVALDAVDQALLALTRRAVAPAAAAGPDALQQQVFQQILALTDKKRTADPGLRKALFERLANAGGGSNDEVIYQLALGDFLQETGNPAAAVEHYQAILVDQALAHEFFARDNVSRRADVEALLRIRKLVSQAGPAIYAPFEAEAQQRYAALSHRADVAPADLLELARQYPLASAAAAARLHAAELLLAQHDDHAALQQLKQAYAQSSDRLILGKAVAHLTSIYQKRQRLRLARQWLLQAKRQHPDLLLPWQEQNLPIEQVLLQIDAQAGSGGQLAPLAFPLENPVVLPGRLLTPGAQARYLWPRERLLTLEAGRLRLFAGSPLTILWDVPAPEPAPQLLWLGEEQALFLLPQQQVFIALDGHTGKTLWTSAAVPDLIQAVGSDADLRARRTPEEQDFLDLIDNGPVQFNGRILRPQAAVGGKDLLYQVNEAVLVLSDRKGRALGIDRGNGQILWQQICPMDRVDQLCLSDDDLAFGGIGGVRTSSPNGEILVVDPRTGAAKWPLIHENDVLEWLGFGESGLLLHASRNEVAAHQLGDGLVAWRVTLPQTQLTDAIWVGEGTLMLRDAAGAVILLDAATGQAIGRSPLARPVGNEPLNVEQAEGQWHLLQRWQATTLGRDGKLLWADAIVEPGKNLILQLLSDRLVLLLSFPQPFPQHGAMGEGPMADFLRNPDDKDPADPEPAGYQLYFLDRITGQILHQQQLGPLDQGLDPQQALLLDHRLVLSTGAATIVISDKTAAK